MVGLVTGQVLNTILEPILIFTFHLGIQGAGLSTAISQYISMFILFAMFAQKLSQSRIEWRYLNFSPKLMLNIIKNSFPSLTRQGLNSLSNLCLNVQAGLYGDACIAAMSIVAKCMQLMFSVCVGIGQGFQPVSSFNYGAKKFQRVKQGILFTWGFSSLVIAVLSIASFIFASELIHFFRHDASILSIGVLALRISCVAQLFLPPVSIANMIFQSTGNSGKATFLACAQNGLFFIPLIYLLPNIYGLMGIQMALPLAFILAALISLPFLLRFIKVLCQ